MVQLCVSHLSLFLLVVNLSGLGFGQTVVTSGGWFECNTQEHYYILVIVWGGCVLVSCVYSFLRGGRLKEEEGG